MKKNILSTMLLTVLLCGCSQEVEQQVQEVEQPVQEVEQPVQENNNTINLNDNVRYIVKNIVSNQGYFEIENIDVKFDESFVGTTNEVGYKIIVDLENNTYGFEHNCEEKMENLAEEVANISLDKLYNDYQQEYNYYVEVNIENYEVVLGTYNGNEKNVFFVADEIINSYYSNLIN